MIRSPHSNGFPSLRRPGPDSRRWALEEAGLPYKTRLLELGSRQATIARSALGQVRSLRKRPGLFEPEHRAAFANGAMRAEQDAGARARPCNDGRGADSIEQSLEHCAIDLFYAKEEWAKLRRPGAVEFVRKRLSALAKSLGDKPYLDGDRFTTGDLMMTTVLRILKHTDIVTGEKRLAAYVERCTSRPAFKRAFDAQIGDFRKAA